MSEIEIAVATPGDSAAIFDLLRLVQLPTDGLEAHLDTAIVARCGGEVIGSAALEIYADGALLRSVAVNPDHRGRSLGHGLIAAALDRAANRGLPAVYLLTTTAESYFPRFGFETIDRTQVPASVQASVEFQGACPASAVAMRKTLSPKA